MNLTIIILLIALVAAIILLHYVSEQAEMFKQNYFEQLNRARSLESQLNATKRELEYLRKELHIINP